MEAMPTLMQVIKLIKVPALDDNTNNKLREVKIALS